MHTASSIILYSAQAALCLIFLTNYVEWSPSSEATSSSASQEVPHIL
jgi:hypothetical protein